MNTSDNDGRRIVTIQSLSNTQLIQILQFHDGDDELTQMVEEELARRKSEGAPQWPERKLVACGPTRFNAAVDAR